MVDLEREQDTEILRDAARLLEAENRRIVARVVQLATQLLEAQGKDRTHIQLELAKRNRMLFGQGSPSGINGALRELAEREGATIMETPLATIVVIPRSASTNDAGAMLPLGEAARVAGTSIRVIRDAIRAGDLSAFGKQRDRSVRRNDLDKWIESRRVRPIEGPDDDDIERRMRRLEKNNARRGEGRVRD